MSSKAIISELQKSTMADQPRRHDCVRFPAGQDALLFSGLRTVLKARALHSNLRARAGFRDARSGTLHGVTSEASGERRWRTMPVERAPPIFSGSSRLITFACRGPD